MRILPTNNLIRPNFYSNKQPADKKKNSKCDTYLLAGSVGLAVIAGYFACRKTNTKRLDGIISKSDFFKICENSKLENYKATPENIQNGVFNIDLHSHSNHSDGWAKVPELLDEIAVYADKVYQKTGKKFTFALTDHDRVSGVKEALEIINKDPKKFKNLNFIPGVELSFQFNSGGEIKSGELLAYFVKPDSKEMKILVEDLNKNRLNMIEDGVKQLGQEFSRSEMNNYFINSDGETFAYNLHWRLFNYVQIKNRINNIAKEKGVDSSILYKKLMDGYVFGNSRVPKPFVSPEGFDKYLKKIKYQTSTTVFDENISRICKEFFPKLENGKIVSASENSYEKIIDTLKSDDDVILAFAHPYFTSAEMSDFKSEFDSLIRYSNGKIKMSESYHQAYKNDVPKYKIQAVNQYLESKGLIPIGGRDNHKGRFL